MRPLLATIAGLIIFAGSHAQADDLVVLARTLHTSGSDGIIENAAIVIKDGKIDRVGVQGEIRLPDGVAVREAAVVLPGLIDMRTTLGLSGMYNVPADQDQDEVTGPTQAQLRALDSYNPREPLIDYVRSYGVTTVHATPGDLNLIAGQGSVFKTAGDSVGEAVLKPVASMVFNLGENPKMTYGARDQAPGTRMASAAMIRQALYDARHYADGDDEKVDLAKAALAKVVEGETPALFTVFREDDIATALRIAREFELDLWLNYVTEGYLMRDVLAESSAKIILGPTTLGPAGLQTYNATYENPALLHAAGIPLTFSTGHESYVPKEHILLFELGIAIANGYPADAAIRAATIEAAELLGLDERIGSIERGKDADLVMFDGDPFEYTSHVLGVVIDGREHRSDIR